jgi:vancomycin resistance protein YoaR
MSAPHLTRRRFVGGAIALGLLGPPRTARGNGERGRTVLARYGTAYKSSGGERARARNIELAAEAIDRKTLAPDGIFSFNDAVGERSLGNGFERSRVLREHLLAEGIGGGTCQVASTLHATALLAGLEIVERAPHSRPSAYIPMGLDATVAFPLIDLKVKNPGPEPLLLRALVGRDHLDIWIDTEGPDRPRVSLTCEILDRMPPPREIERDPRVPVSEVHVRAYGIPGYRVERTREVRRGSDVRRDLRVDTYLPVTEVLAVNPAFDLGRLGQREPLDTHEGVLAPPVVRDEPGAEHPALIQLHPEAVSLTSP